MKSLRLLLCLFLLPALHPAARAMPSDRAEMAADRMRAFYRWYLHALNSSEDADPLRKQRGELKKYVSARFLKKIDKASKVEGGIEADPFLCAQDFDKDWEKNIAIKDVKVNTDNDSISATVRFSGKEMNHVIKVVVVFEDDEYKLDRAEPLDL